jgi:hypothetical protein
MSMNSDSLGIPEERLSRIEQLPLDQRAEALSALHDELKEFLDSPGD